jgi:hypothetical protein
LTPLPDKKEFPDHSGHSCGLDYSLGQILDAIWAEAGESHPHGDARAAYRKLDIFAALCR